MWIIILITIVHDFSRILTAENKLVIIPFTLKQIKYNSRYNSTFFLNDLLFNDIIIDVNIGTPLQKVPSKIDFNSKCFLMKTQDPDEVYDTNLYSPKLSTTFIKRSSKSFIDNITFESNEGSNTIEFSIVDNGPKFNYSNYDYIPVLGLDIPQFDSNCPNFFINLKKKELINKYIWTIEFINDKEGNLVIGDDLSVYNKSKYSENEYYTTYTSLRNLIIFDSIYIDNIFDNNKHYLNMTQTLLFNNYGVIVGPNEYKQLIDKIFFNELIEKKICSVDIVEYIYNKNSKAGLKYYVYSCDEREFKDRNNYYFNKFPKLVFTLKSVEHNFFFSKEDLFVHIYNKYYFLVIFQTNTNVKEIIWYLGEPFFKKYSLSFNFDAKTIGFYFKKDNNDPTEDNKDDIKKSTKTNNVALIIIIIIEVIAIATIIVFIVIYWKHIGTMRKNRVNEINDDNYEYLSEKNNKKEDSEIN